MACDPLGRVRLALTQHVGLMFPIVESSADLPVPSITHSDRGPHVRQQAAALRDPLARRGRDARARMEADRQRARSRVPAARGGRAVRQGGHADGGRLRLARPRLHPRAGRQGAAQLRRAGAQPGAQRAHRRRPHGVLVGLRAAVRAPGRRAPRRHDRRLPQLREARALVPRARHDRRHDRRAQRHAARLAPPRHGATRCRRSPTRPTWARSPRARTRPTRSA